MQVSDEQIQATAQRIVGCELHDIQVTWVRAMLEGHLIGAVRRAGYTTAFRVARAIWEEQHVH